MITGKTIVLTGANSGIGLEVLKLLVKGDNKILAVDLFTDKLAEFDKNKVIPMQCDVSTKENVDLIFETAIKELGSIDIFYANAGFPYYESFDYTDWDRVEKMFATNTFSPIYTYARYVKHLDGRDGILAITVSAIGQMAMPGYAIYSASKFGLQGFQQAIRLEKPKNLQITCLYPVATDTNFFKVANPVSFEKPFPVQKPTVVAKKMVEGIEQGKPFVSPCFLFDLSKTLMTVIPPIRSVYWEMETAKLRRFKKKLKAREEKLIRELDEVQENVHELEKNVRKTVQAGKEKLHGL